MKKVKDLLNKSAEELKNTPKEEIHDGYKKIVAQMLTDFYIFAAESDVKTMNDLRDVVCKFINTNIKFPHKDWQPGDQGK